MKKGEVYAIDVGAVYRPAHKALHGKILLAWCYGPAGKLASGEPLYRFAVGDTLFDKKPALAEVRKRKLVVNTLTNNNPAGVAAVYDAQEAPSRGVTLLGELTSLPPLTPKQIKQQPPSGGWVGMALDYNFHWREIHDGASLKRARDAEDAKEKKKAGAATKKRRAGGLAGMARRTLLADWKGLVSKKRADATRAILKAAIAELLKTKETSARTKVLEKAVLAINAYDDKQGGFIETPEREALMECLEDLASASGLGNVTEQLNDWRDW
ncbi:MAG: hypothetical protein H0T89_01535 [Deltaproteobacteria bacterium]|nr:hypothetical protein [Deltaproteobacteria bacterium]MDQ3297676.1 hypothetical protein [Myxococcota bacterium]